MAPGFFGQRTSWREGFLEEAYLLIKHLNMSFFEIYSLPVTYRRWFLDRFLKDLRDKSERARKGSTSNTSKVQTMDVPFGEMGRF